MAIYKSIVNTFSLQVRSIVRDGLHDLDG